MLTFITWFVFYVALNPKKFQRQLRAASRYCAGIADRAATVASAFGPEWVALASQPLTFVEPVLDADTATLLVEDFLAADHWDLAANA